MTNRDVMDYIKHYPGKKEVKVYFQDEDRCLKIASLQTDPYGDIVIWVSLE